MKNNMVWEIIKKELRDIIRDKKTLFMMIVFPVILCPFMLGFIMKIQDNMMSEEVDNGKEIGICFDADETFETTMGEFNFVKVTGDENELTEKVKNGELGVFLTKDDNKFIIHYSSKTAMSGSDVAVVEKLIDGYKRIIQQDMLTNEGLVPEDILDVYSYDEIDVLEKDPYASYVLSMVPTFIIMTTTLTAIFAAIDMTSGEKERGTLETLFTFPLKLGDIIKGKILASTICTMISSVVGFFAMFAVLNYIGKNLENLTFELEMSVATMFLSIVSFAFYALMISTIAIILASKAKSFKEAQNTTQPLSIVTMLPMFMSMMGMKLTPTLALIPIVNVNMIISDVIIGDVDYKCFALMIVSTLVITGVVIKLINKLYKSDNILFS